MTRRELLAGSIFGAMSVRADDSARPRRITLRSADGVNVYGWYYSTSGKNLPAILLFHQAGSNHADRDRSALGRPDVG
jgi:dipeptidyl aminopeptidase/acylaminoacyl peptidase